ncbi:hypothetical protein OsJ_07911 [Oryza sativa Japonica Group]|uniref:Uncharacterized protein n=1 Tax=Oryza sativa subsp. japonica TaxID=39947 RepID=A3AA26_ORYSJ|nr:hypothetical protein OsJ_07911 [Oryza sativa Japonica Group]
MGNEEGEWDRGKEGVQWRSSLTSGGDVSEELWGDGWLGLEEKHMFIVKSTTREQRGNKGCEAYQDGQMSLNQSQVHDDDTLEDRWQLVAAHTEPRSYRGITRHRRLPLILI